MDSQAQPPTVSTPAPSAVLTVAEAGAFLRIDPRTIRAMVRAGELEGNQHGHCIRITRESVVDWARGKRRVPPSRRHP